MKGRLQLLQSMEACFQFSATHDLIPRFSSNVESHHCCLQGFKLHHLCRFSLQILSHQPLLFLNFQFPPASPSAGVTVICNRKRVQCRKNTAENQFHVSPLSRLAARVLQLQTGTGTKRCRFRRKQGRGCSAAALQPGL
jgi:hypothetical protein